MMQTYELLEAALVLIPDADHWTQRGCIEEDGPVTRYCAFGALDSAWLVGEAELTDRKTAQAALDRAAESRGFPSHISLNMETDYPTVRAMYQEAIRAEKQKLGVDLDLPQPDQQEALANA